MWDTLLEGAANLPYRLRLTELIALGDSDAAQHEIQSLLRNGLDVLARKAPPCCAPWP